MTACGGRAWSSNAGVEDVLLPWWPTCSRVMGVRGGEVRREAPCNGGTVCGGVTGAGSLAPPPQASSQTHSGAIPPALFKCMAVDTPATLDSRGTEIQSERYGLATTATERRDRHGNVVASR